MTWQEERGMKRTVDDDGTVRYDGQVAIQESIQNKLKGKEVFHFPATEDENEINVCSWIDEEKEEI